MYFFTIKLIVLAVICDAARISSSNDDDGIIGGDPIDIKQAPYIVSMQYGGEHACGASIIAKDLILSAAHCIIGKQVKYLAVRAGSTYRSKGGEVIKVQSAKYHEKYVHDAVDYDVGIMRLVKPLQLSDSIQIIPMASADDKLNEGDLCAVSGWGNTVPNLDLGSEILQQVKVPFVGNARCSKMYGGRITDRMICAAYDKGGKDSCQGDSGGPLIYENKQFGIVSWGDGCAKPNKPGVYSSVAAFRNWIDDNSKLL